MKSCIAVRHVFHSGLGYLEKEMEHWLICNSYKIAHTQGVDVLTLRADTKKYASSMEMRSKAVIKNWLNQLEY